jgi:hypothetical protein
MKKVVDSPYPSDREILDRIIAGVSVRRPELVRPMRPAASTGA